MKNILKMIIIILMLNFCGVQCMEQELKLISPNTKTETDSLKNRLKTDNQPIITATGSLKNCWSRLKKCCNAPVSPNEISIGCIASCMSMTMSCLIPCIVYGTTWALQVGGPPSREFFESESTSVLCDVLQELTDLLAKKAQ